MSAVGESVAASLTAKPSALAGGDSLAIVAITAFALFWQMRWGTVPDTSWLITVCERVLAGERLYVDLFETNPPFSVWLYMPAVALAQRIGIASEHLVHAWTYLLVAAGFLLAAHVAARARFPEGERLAALAPAFYVMLVIFPGNAFSEREHIGAALFLPLLVLMAWRARTDAATEPDAKLAIAVGSCASILLLVKPYYALIVLASSLFVCWRRRSVRPLFGLEHWVIGMICLAYLASVMLFHPEFVRDIFPVVSNVYMKVRSYFQIAIIFSPAFALLMFFVWRLWPIDRVPELASVATLASIAGFVTLVIQGKGWPYHAYPALLFAICALLCLLALPSRNRRCASWTGRHSLLMKPGVLMLSLALLVSFASFWPSQKPVPELVSTIRATAERPSVAVIGSDLSNGHPLTRMLKGHWAETYVSDWLGVAAVELTAAALHKGDQTAAAHYRAILDRYAAGKRAEYSARRPDIVVVQKNEQHWFDYLVQSKGFGEILAAYGVLFDNEDNRVYLRSDYRKPN